MAVIADWFGGYMQGEREASAQYLDELASIRAQRAADLDYTMTVLEPAMTYDRDQRAFQQRMDEMDRRSALAREEDARARALGAWWTGEWEHPFIDAVAQEAYGDLLTQYGPPQRRPGQTQSDKPKTFTKCLSKPKQERITLLLPMTMQTKLSEKWRL